MSVLQKIKIAGTVLMVLGAIIFFASDHKFIAGAIGAIGALLFFFDKYRNG